jgi:hypothetical protein
LPDPETQNSQAQIRRRSTLRRSLSSIHLQKSKKLRICGSSAFIA